MIRPLAPSLVLAGSRVRAERARHTRGLLRVLISLGSAATLAIAGLGLPALAHAAGTQGTSTTRLPSRSSGGAASEATGTGPVRTPSQGTSSPGATGATGGRLGQFAPGAAARSQNGRRLGTSAQSPAAGGTAVPSSAPSASQTTAPTGSAGASSTLARPPTSSLPPVLTGGQLGRASRAAGSPRHRSGGVSALAIVIAALGALLVLACAAWALARRRAFEPHWLLSLRHSMAEAGYRTSATWAEFKDWARLGH